MSVTLIEFSEAYSIFSNNGTQVKPYIIDQIINKNGDNVIFEPQFKEINKPEQSYLMTSILVDVVNKGTGKRCTSSRNRTCRKNRYNKQ